MSKFMFFLVACVLMAAGYVQAANYGFQSKKPSDITTMLPSDVGDNHYGLLYDTGNENVEKAPMALLSEAAETSTAAETLTVADCGKVIYFGSTGHDIILPAATAGCYFKFIVAIPPSTASQTISTPSLADLIVAQATHAATHTVPTYDDDADRIGFISGTAVVGDTVELRSDGTSWYAQGLDKINGGISFVTED